MSFAPGSGIPGTAVTKMPWIMNLQNNHLPWLNWSSLKLPLILSFSEFQYKINKQWHTVAEFICSLELKVEPQVSH